MAQIPVLAPEKNCWKQCQVDQGGFLPSGRDFFRAFRAIVRSAEREVILLAWDLCETVEMVRDAEDDDGYPSTLADFLITVLQEKPELRIKILLWDYSVIYAAEREWLPFTKLGRLNHPRFELITDDTVPAGASHHQKLVVVDGAVAICGGLDLAAWRWDSPEHRADDPRRKDPKGKPYQPYHDIQVILTGQAADCLRELASSRWQRATGEALPAPPDSAGRKHWPDSVPVDFENLELGIALTYAPFQTYPAVRQIEQLYLDAIRAASRTIYIENQYLTSKVLVDALCQKLNEAEGPEIFMLLNREAGWAENMTMGRMRNRLLEKLRAADRHGRFRCYYPCADGGTDQQIYVHAKLMIVDRRILITGSANMTNRSMHVDSELNLGMIEEQPANYIQRLQERLLAMHLYRTESEVTHSLENTGSIFKTIEKLNRSHSNHLRPLHAACKSDLERRLADTQLLDPDEPLSPIHDVWGALQAQGKIYWGEKSSSPYLKFFKVLAVLIALMVAGLAVAHLWKAGFSQEQASSLLASLKDEPGVLPLVVLVFVIGGIIAVPINLLVVAAALTFGAWTAIACAMSGSLLAAAASFGLGHHFGKPLVRKIIGERLDAIIASLRGRGVGSMIVIRLLPIAPFGLINLVAGVSGLRFAVFMVGSAIGTLPGFAAVVLATTHFQKALENPAWQNWLIFFVLVGAIVGLFAWAKKRFT